MVAVENLIGEAVQIFGGSGNVKAERIYRGIKGIAIPGGSKEILLDFAFRDLMNRNYK
jgi:alkylation response protein AidB-like acyl-CoA dehydrogenase